MTSFPVRMTAIGIFVAALGAAGPLPAAQGLDVLKNLGGNAGVGTGSLMAGSTANAAGVLEFCVRNNYLSGASASSIKDRLMGKIPGAKPASNRGYLDGARGILTGSDGGKVDLNGGGLKAKLTKKACDVVLKQGKSML